MNSEENYKNANEKWYRKLSRKAKEQWQKFRQNKYFEQILVWSGLGLVFVASVVTILCTKTTVNQVEQEPTKYDVTQNADSPYPDKMLAPFVDMVSWVDTTNNYSINGVPDLGKIYDDIGLDYFNLGFVRVSDSKPLEDDGTIRWCWGGYYNLSPKGDDGTHYAGIKRSIANLRSRGGDVIVSVGGQLGKAPWVVSSNVDKLAQMYLEIIDAYGLKRIDLDIEESNQGYEVNLANAKAVKKAQDQTEVEVTLTIPVMPSGWSSTQENLIKAYLESGVKVKMVNIMAMCYGGGLYSGEDYGDASIRAIDNAAGQLSYLYKEVLNKTVSVEEAYKMLGVTVDIGYENSSYPTFTAQMTRKVADYANERNLQMFSYWSMNRDAKLQSNKGVNFMYEFFDASLNFLEK